METHAQDVYHLHEAQPPQTVSCLCRATSLIGDEGRRSRVYKPLTGVLIPPQSVASLFFLFVRSDIDACEGVGKAIAKLVDCEVQNGFDAGKDPLN